MRQGEVYGDGASSSELGDADGKNRGEERMRMTTASQLYNAAKEHGDDTQQPPHASAKPKMATGAPESWWKLTDGES